MKKLDAIANNLESMLREVQQSPRSWKVQWFEAVANRRTDKLPKLVISPTSLSPSSRRR